MCVCVECVECVGVCVCVANIIVTPPHTGTEEQGDSTATEEDR